MRQHRRKTGTLYQRLGAQPGVVRVVDDLLVNLKADPRVRERFENIDEARFKQRLVEQICVLGSGPCEYRGASMTDAHRGMQIGNEQFDAFIGDLAKSLDQHGVGPAEQRELLFALQALRAEIMDLPP